MNVEQVRAFGNIELLARQLVEGFITGLHKSPYHGFSVEFAEHRLYNAGESTRHIDWKVYAKTDRLYTKRYEEETNLRCLLLLDNSPSMHYPVKGQGKITFSLMGAAALAHLLQRQRDAVGLTTFSEEVEVKTAIKSTAAHLHSLFIHLQNLLDAPPRQKKSAVARVLHQVAEQIHKRSLVIIFSDMFDNHEEQEEIFRALQHLKHNHHEVLIFHVTDHQTERSFAFEDRPYEFIDLETQEKLRLQPHQIREQYEQARRADYQLLESRCNQLKIDLITADIHQGWEPVLQAYLIKRGKMR